MRKQLWGLVLCMALSMMALNGCSQGDPEKVVERFSDAMISFDRNKMAECIDELDELELDYEDSIFDNDELSCVNELLMHKRAHTDYRITSIKNKLLKKVVTVEYTYDDVSSIVDYTLYNAFEDALSGRFEYGSSIEDRLRTNFFEPEKNKSTIEYTCKKEDGVWKIDEIDNVDTLQDILFLNFNHESYMLNVLTDYIKEHPDEVSKNIYRW